MTVTESEVCIGTPAVAESFPGNHRFGVVFEDDGETGYFYGLDTSRGDDPIVDALYIYGVGRERQPGERCLVRVTWSADLERAILYLDGRPEAAFDFVKQRATCRSNFPPANGTFTTTHAWDESLLGLR